MLSCVNFNVANSKFIGNNDLVFASEIKDESNKEFLQKRLCEANEKYGTNLFVVSDYDYEKTSKTQLNDSVSYILKQLDESVILKNNNISVRCLVANSSVSIPTQTILCAMWPVKLEGTISYTAESCKFKSIDSLNTWITGDEFLIKHTWTQHSWDKSITNNGKNAQVSLRGTLKGEMLVKGSPIAFTQEVDRSFGLNF